MATAPAGAIRRFYEGRNVPVPAGRVRKDVMRLLEDRMALQRAADQLMDAAMPYSGDPKVKEAIDRLRSFGAPS